MPIYDFRCNRCSHTFETLVLKTPPVLCPACGQAELTRLVSKPATPGQTRKIIANGRAQAQREGHFSHYAAHEKPKG